MVTKNPAAHDWAAQQAAATIDSQEFRELAMDYRGAPESVTSISG